MSKESKKLKESYTEVVKDIFDHFDEYTAEEKNQVKICLNNLQNLNNILDKYDRKKKNKNIWEQIAEWWNNATGKN